jgi:hypothetical protein
MNRTLFVCLFAALLCVGCQATKAPPSDPVPSDPDVAVASIRNAWFNAPSGQLHAGYGAGARPRVLLRRQAENLVFRHPRHVGARMLCAIMAYEASDPITAGRHLDAVLRIAPATPDAALLRARIAVEAGNPILAQRLLTQQVALRPDHAGLRETLASVKFLTGDYAGAEQDLLNAERLGAHPARLAYNRGLLAEHRGDVSGAIAGYQQALALAPDWALPQERLKGVGEDATTATGPSVAERISVWPGEFAAPPPPPLPPQEPPVPSVQRGDFPAPLGNSVPSVFSEVPIR